MSTHASHPEAPDSLPNLSPEARARNQTLLYAGSAGYQHFQHQLAPYISPSEASFTAGRFKNTARIFWLTLVLFAVAYFSLNWLIGPHSLIAAAVVNDLLRALVVGWALFLARRASLAVAAELLLPVLALCFLPFHPASAPDWSITPLLFCGLVAALFFIGWLIDCGCAAGTAAFLPLRRALLVLAPVLLILLALAGWFWITDHGSFPIFTVIAGLFSFPFLQWIPTPFSASTDVQFLYAAAWSRWRFSITGRVLALFLGAVPFLLFTNLLDFQDQLEEALRPESSAEILRAPFLHEPWHAYYWRQEGRFLTTEDLELAEESNPAPVGIYLTSPTTVGPSLSLPEQYKGDEFAPHLPEGINTDELEAKILALSGQHLSREAFNDALAEFKPFQIDSLGKLLRRQDWVSGRFLISISFHPLDHDAGLVIAERMDMHIFTPEAMERIILANARTKWIFLGFGLLGFLFLWRRGGDSSLARWIGIWLIGTNLVPSINVSDDTFAHPRHWLWEQSIIHHWNTLSSSATPAITLLFIAAAVATLLWLTHVSPTISWVSLCWPTRIYPNHPPIVRNLIIFGKTLAAIFAADCLFLAVVAVSSFFHFDGDGWNYAAIIGLWSIVFIPSGALLRIVTRKYSELPHLGVLPTLALVFLNLSLTCYAPAIMINVADQPVHTGLLAAGSVFGVLFIALALFLILKRDFLRIRAISSFTTIVLLFAVPFAIHTAEEFIPPYLTSGPFFREKGAELVSLMLVVLVFPFVHEWLHEALLLLSVPLLRRIEHRVEHALDHIIDAETPDERSHLVSELLTELHVSHYLFLSRRPRGRFIIDINTLPNSHASSLAPAPAAPIPPSPPALPPFLELSPAVCHFLGKRRHFIDLHTTAYEWPFFFHQFELRRLAQTTHARFLLPIAVGDSLRGLLLLADGPPEAVFSTPALSTNINNLGLATALSRPYP